MNRKQLLWLVCVGLAAAPGSSTAQSSTPLAPDIETVVSGGSWSQDSLSGYYRVIIRTGGFDHILSTLQIDWVTETTESADSRLVRSRLAEDINAAGSRLSDPVFHLDSAFGLGWVLSLHSFNTHLDQASEETLYIQLGPPGEMSRVSFRQ